MISFSVATATTSGRDREIPDSLLQELKLNLVARNVSQGMAVLDKNAGLIASLDPGQSNAAGLAAYVAQWVDVGYRQPGMVEAILGHFPREARSRLAVGDYLQLRMAEGALALAQDRPDDARFHFDFVLSLQEEIADRALVSLAHYWNARCHRRKGEYDDALRHTASARKLALELGFARMAAVMQVLESWLHFQKGSRREAMQLLDQSEDVLRHTDDYITLGNIYSARGRMIRRKGQYKEALDLYSQAIEYFKKRSLMHNNLARSLANIAHVQRLIALQISRQIDVAKARRVRKAAVPPAQGSKWQDQRDQCEWYRAQAFANLDQAEEIYRQNHQHHGIGNVYENRGLLFLDTGELDQAAAQAELVYKLGREARDYILIARGRQLQCAIGLAKLEEGIEDDSHSWEIANQARDYARQAVDAARHTQNQRLLARSYVWAGLSAGNALIDDLADAKHYYELTNSLLRAVDYEDQWEELQRLREMVDSRGNVNAQLRAWSQGNTGGKSFQQMTEQFAEIIIPVVWKTEKEKIARVATRLRISPKKVRRILIKLGLLKNKTR
jgi:tetratricopeptide (TPR) repeat protein